MEEINRITKTDKPLPGITQEHLDAIYFFAKASGPEWREKLEDAWLSGNYGGYKHSHLLQQVRNRIKPSTVGGLLSQFVVHHKKVIEYDVDRLHAITERSEQLQRLKPNPNWSECDKHIFARLQEALPDLIEAATDFCDYSDNDVTFRLRGIERK